MLISTFQAQRFGQGPSCSKHFGDLTALAQMPTILWSTDGHHVSLYMDHGSGSCSFHLENTPILPLPERQSDAVIR